MSSFLAKLEMDGEVYNVLQCKYNFNQNIDNTGKPHGSTKGGKIILTIESSGRPTFIDWMISPHKIKDGTIIFYRRDAMSKLQEVVFEKGYCIEFSEEFDAINDQPMKITVLISARKLVITNVAFENSWNLQ